MEHNKFLTASNGNRWGRRLDHLIPALLAITYFTMLVFTLDIGFPRDESFYFYAGERYSRWFDLLIKDPKRAFTKEAINEHFEYNKEHPALPKILFGLSWRVFGRMHDPAQEPWTRQWYFDGDPPKTILGIMDESTAMRLPALISASFLIYLLCRFGIIFFNTRIAVTSTIAFMFMPHAFWHAHLACFDMPVTTAWFAVCYCYLMAEKTGKIGWHILTSVAWGIALNVKHNTFFIVPTLLLYFLITRWREFGIDKKNGVFKVPSIPLSFVFMATISPIVYYVLWPKLWFDPIDQLKFYFNFHFHHVMYWAYYFGDLISKPPYPWGFSFVMSAVTIPGPTVFMAIIGLLLCLWNWIRIIKGKGTGCISNHRGAVFFVFINFFIPFLLIGNPKVPVFGGTKHWLPGVPFLTIFAGIAAYQMFEAISGIKEIFPSFSVAKERIANLMICLAFISPLMLDTFHGYTNGSTFYNAFVGGFSAMGELRMQREFWGNTAFSALPFINENAPVGSRVHFHDTTYDAVKMYWRDGLLRRDIIPVWDQERADYYLFHWHKEFLNDEAYFKNLVGVEVPIEVVAQDGVPLLNIYERPNLRRGSSGAK